MFDPSPDALSPSLNPKLLAKWKELGPLNVTEIHAKLLENNLDVDVKCPIEKFSWVNVTKHGQLDYDNFPPLDSYASSGQGTIEPA